MIKDNLKSQRDNIKISDQFLLRYVPEKEDPIKLFSYFGISEYSFDRQGKSIILSIISRLEKSSILWSYLLDLCNKAHIIENEEINQHGYSKASYSKLASIIFESILDQYYNLYSNFAIIVHKIYHLGSPKGKWFKLKRGVIEGKYPSIPIKINDIFKSIEIDNELEKIRTESAHYSTGFLNTFVKPYSYMNEQVGPIGKTPDNVLLISNIDEFHNKLRSETVELLNLFFQFVMDNVDGKKQTLHICGYYRGYLYQQYECYSDFMSGKRGHCKPIWEVPNPVASPCPLVNKCKAYHNYLNEK